MSVQANNYVVDVSETEFQKKVIERSHEKPVIVDFWAPWCGPCRVLGPRLESAVEKQNGEVILAKVNTDENPGVAREYGIRGIPAVKGFRDGQVVEEFVGAQPQRAIQDFLDRLAPSETDALVGQARRLEESNQLQQAEVTYREALEAEPERYSATVGLARVLLRQNRPGEAIEYLEQIPPYVSEFDEAKSLLTMTELQEFAGRIGGEEACRGRLAEDPSDLDARYGLAGTLANQGRYEEALEQLLEIVRGDRTYRDGAARDAMLALFKILGDDSDVASSYRARLANALF